MEEPILHNNGKPIIEQLEYLATVMGFSKLLMFKGSMYEEGLRNLHALVQKSTNGDEKATRKLSFLRERFGS